MEIKKRYSIKNILVTIIWLAISTGTVVLLVAAIRKKDAQHCKGVAIEIKGVNNNFFVDKNDILNSITELSDENPVGKSIGSFNLHLIEKELRRKIWVKNAELFFDNNEMLQVKVNEREPVARIFTSSGNTFYIDDEVSILPLSEKFSARLPVFTNFPSDKMLSNADSNLLHDIKIISLAIQKDSFCMAMIDQIDINAQRNFEMIPKIGNQLIFFGDASDVNEKINKLKLFYKEVMVKAGWNNYSIINLQYKNQVVAKRKGMDDIKADSLRTLQLMQAIAANAEKLAGDSLQTIRQENERIASDSIMIQQSLQRDENIDAVNSTLLNTTLKNKKIEQPVLNSGNPSAEKNVVKQNSMPLQKPKPAPSTKKIDNNKKQKIVMPPKNDY